MGEEESRMDDPEMTPSRPSPSMDEDANETTDNEPMVRSDGVDFFFEHYNGNLSFLEARPGMWTGHLPVPADVRSLHIGGFPVPASQVSSRRVIHMIAPTEIFANGTSEKVIDDLWTQFPRPRTNFSWSGSVTFFEQTEGEEQLPFGKGWQKHGGRGPYEDRPRDAGRPSEPSDQNSRNMASSSSNYRPPGHHKGGKQRAVLCEATESSPSQGHFGPSSSADVQVFDTEHTDHDGAWVLSPGLQEHVYFEESSKPTSFSLSNLKNNLVRCPRRRSFLNRRSLFSSMRRTLFQAAQAFVTRLVLCHGAQEEDASSFGRCAIPNLRDVEERGCTDPSLDSQAGRSTLFSGMGPNGESFALHAGDRAEPDGPGLLAGEGHHGRLHPGGRVPAGEGEGSEEGFQEDQQPILDPTGNRQSTGQVSDPSVLGQRTSRLPTCSRTSSVQSQQVHSMVGVSDLRIKVGEKGRRSVRFDGGEHTTSPKGQESPNQRGKLSATPTSTEVPTESRQSSTGTYSSWRADLLDGPWRDWIRGANSPDHQPDDRDQGPGRQVQEGSANAKKIYVKGSQDDWSSSNSAPEDAGADLRDAPGRLGDSGAGGRERFANMAGGGHEHRVRSRVLVHKEQLGGKNGSKLRALLERHFPKFMVFLCLNCCLTPATTEAFGSPEFTACYFADQFKSNNIFEPVSPLRTPHDFVNCYVYGQMAQHFASASHDTQGVTKPLHKEIKKMLVKNLKDQPSVMEIYCPPRLAERAEKHGFQCGGSLDLTTGWDFNLKKHQEAALRLINRMKPSLILLCPPCTTFSSLRYLSNFKRQPKVVAAEEEEGLRHLRFSILIAKLQHRNGRGFLFEHPKRATSWKRPELQQLRDEPGVYAVDVDLCRFGLTTTQGQPALKPTLLLTNIEELAITLGRRCDGHHKKHQPLLAGEAGHAAKYTPLFVENILRGLRLHLEAWTKSHRAEQDYWETKPGEIIRHHRQPRRALYVPAGVSGCPFKSYDLASTRTTSLRYLDGKKATFVDDWRSTSTPRRTFSGLWTGSTRFELKCPMVLPNDWQQAANFIVASAAHPLHNYLTEDSAMQVDWQFAFPAHRTLRGADPSSSLSAPSSSQIPLAERPFVDAMDDEDEDTALGKTQEALKSMELDKVVDEGMATLHPALRREVLKVHRNLGHPSLQAFTRALRHAGAKQEVVEWVKHHFKCPLCERKQQPSSHRPGHLQKAMAFNEVVGIDLLKVNVPTIEKEYLMMNCLCWGTDLQIVEPLANKQASTVFLEFSRSWIAHYGPPSLLVADQGREFIGQQFAESLAHLGVPIYYTNARSPWENGRTERAGGIFKSRLETTLHEISATTDEEVRAAIYEVVAAHNRYYNRSGFTPYQRAFGVLPRLPGSLLSDDVMDKQLVLEGGGDAMQRSWQIREEAAKSWLRWQDDEAVRRAVSTRTRTSDNKHFELGELVYIWRNVPNFKGWSGPGTLIAQKDDTMWVSMRGYLMKASKAQTRKATSEESRGAELVRHLSAAMLEDLEKDKVKLYRDIAGEGAPDEDEDSFSYAPTTPRELPDDQLDTIMEEADADPSESQGVLNPEQQQDEPMAEDPGGAPGELLAPPSEASTETPQPSAPPIPSRDTSRRTSIQVDEGRGGSLSFGPIRDTTSTPAMPYPSPPQGVPSWPRPSSNNLVKSHYLEVFEEPDEMSPSWVLDRSNGRYTMKSSSSSKFDAKQASAFFNTIDKCLYLTKTKTSPGQVEFRSLNEKHKKIFRAARAKEVKSLLDSGAIRILSVKESLEFLRNNPQHVLTSRYVDRWKPTDRFGVLPEKYGEVNFEPADHEGLAAKSRWCVVGWRDPHIHQIERAAPTPLTSSIYLMMQLAAARKWKAVSKDAKTAFLQGRPTTRSQKLACRMPPDECFEGYDPNQLILLLTEVYGLVSGPSWWRRSLLEILVKELGYRVNVYDRCILTLDGPQEEDPNKQVPTQGILVLEVDDMLEAGNEVHRQKMQILEQKLRFGKVVQLMDMQSEGSGYAGRRLRQLSDYSFEIDMTDYVQNRLTAVQANRKTLKKDAAKTLLDEEEIAQLRGTVAAINWAAREGRPDGSAAASILSGCFPSPTMQDLLECNRVVEMLKQREVKIKIHSIEEEDLRHLLVVDSSFDPSGRNKPQHGWIQAMSTPALNRGIKAPVSLIAWRSKKLRRKAGSTTLCESVSLSTALAAMEKQYATMLSFRISRFDPKMMMDDEEIQMGLRGPSTVIAEENPRYTDPDTVCVIDAKSVYDSTANPERQFQGEDDRAALESAIIQESLAKLKARLRWLPHNLNPSDGLTKLPSAAHMAPLYDLLKNHEMVIQKEETELASGRQGDRRLKVHAAWVSPLSTHRTLRGCGSHFAV